MNHNLCEKLFAISGLLHQHGKQREPPIDDEVIRAYEQDDTRAMNGPIIPLDTPLFKFLDRLAELFTALDFSDNLRHVCAVGFTRDLQTGEPRLYITKNDGFKTNGTSQNRDAEFAEELREWMCKLARRRDRVSARERMEFSEKMVNYVKRTVRPYRNLVKRSSQEDVRAIFPYEEGYPHLYYQAMIVRNVCKLMDDYGSDIPIFFWTSVIKMADDPRHPCPAMQGVIWPIKKGGENFITLFVCLD